MAVNERDPEADGATAGPRIRLDAQEIADGVWLIPDPARSFQAAPYRPRPAPVDPLAEFWRRVEASCERSRQRDYWTRRWLLLVLLVAGSLLMVAATHG